MEKLEKNSNMTGDWPRDHTRRYKHRNAS